MHAVSVFVRPSRILVLVLLRVVIMGLGFKYLRLANLVLCMLRVITIAFRLIPVLPKPKNWSQPFSGACMPMRSPEFYEPLLRIFVRRFSGHP